MSAEARRASDVPAELLVAHDPAALAALAADRLARALAEAAAEPGRAASEPVAFAASGGRTPRAAYTLLARDRRVPWGRLAIFLGDERCVPPESDESNVRMLRTALAEARDRLPPGSIHAPWAPEDPREAPTAAALERAARAYEARLPHRLDVLLLGMGADGHVASLFPGSPALEETARRVVPARAPVAPHERLTITPPVIAAARRVLVLVSGAEKAEAVARALGDPATPGAPPPPPAALARHGAWLLDRAAAARLEPR